MTQPKLPLCEAICEEIEGLIPKPFSGYRDGVKDGLIEAQRIIRKHFAALSVEAVARVIETAFESQGYERSESMSPVAHRRVSLIVARAVMQLLRKE
jgi:hypothetical protein